MTVGELVRLVVAAAALVLALVDAGGRRAALRPIPVSGAPIDAPPVSPAPSTPPPITGDGTESSPAVVPLARFAFPAYDPAPLRVDPTPLAAAAFPPPLPSLDGKRARLTGHPLVLEAEGGTVRSLLVTRYPPGCCFGPLPVLDEWVAVALETPVDAAKLAGDRPVTVVGTLEIGERVGDGGGVESLYRLRDARLLAR
ncbi:MAG: hypothetical protein ACF8XB_21775 [Planctomycetota bacterium JB042]